MDNERDCIESVQQLASAWGAVIRDYGLTRADRMIDVREVSGTAYRWAESDFPFWNCLTWTTPRIERSESRERLAQAVDYMKGQQKTGYIWIFEELLSPDARRALPEDTKAVGLQFGLAMHGMAGDILPIPKPAESSLEFVRVNSEEQLRAYADINSQAYGLPLSAGREGLQGSELWKSRMYAYVALEKGVSVSVAATVANDGCLFLALVATLPDEERKGYGEAVVRKAMYEGGKGTGLKRATLHATMAGAPVYERIGYRKTCTIQAFTLPR